MLIFKLISYILIFASLYVAYNNHGEEVRMECNFWEVAIIYFIFLLAML